jgi:hypothetical protein
MPVLYMPTVCVKDGSRRHETAKVIFVRLNMRPGVESIDLVTGIGDDQGRGRLRIVGE